MNKLITIVALPALIAIASPTFAETPRDCLLKGKVMHEKEAGQEKTSVRILSVEKYDSNSRCQVRQGQKMEFKLPHDSRVQGAAEGSDVEYRYRSDGKGNSNTELVNISA